MASKFKKLRDSLEPNKPKLTPDHPTKKAVVLAKEDGKEKLIRFGDQSMSSNYSDEARKNFRSRMSCDEPGSKLSAKYWACKALWEKNSPKLIRKK